MLNKMKTVAIKTPRGVFVDCTRPCFSFSIIVLTAYLFVFQKARLIRLYGKNEKSYGKLKAAQELIAGKEFKEIAQTLHVAEATAQVYGIDAFAAGAPIDHAQLATSLQVTKPNFTVIQCCIEQNKDLKLRTIKDELKVFSYNQIRFVLACMIRDLSL